DAIHQNKWNSFRKLQGLVKCRFVDHLFRLKDCYVRVRAHPNASLVVKHWRTRFQTLRRHQRHLPQRRHQIQGLFLTYIVSEHAGKRPLSARMNFWPGNRQPIAGDHTVGSLTATRAASSGIEKTTTAPPSLRYFPKVSALSPSS